MHPNPPTLHYAAAARVASTEHGLLFKLATAERLCTKTLRHRSQITERTHRGSRGNGGAAHLHSAEESCSVERFSQERSWAQEKDWLKDWLDPRSEMAGRKAERGPCPRRNDGRAEQGQTSEQMSGGLLTYLDDLSALDDVLELDVVHARVSIELREKANTQLEEAEAARRVVQRACCSSSLRALAEGREAVATAAAPGSRQGACTACSPSARQCTAEAHRPWS